MPKQHYYKNFDRDSKLTMELDLRQVAEQLASMNYGVHRLLSHLVDVRRERLAARCAEERDPAIAAILRRKGEGLAEGIAALLESGLY